MDFKKIEFLAESKKLSIPGVARIMGRKKQYLYQIIERGDCKVVDLEKISKALGISPSYWWNEELNNVVEEPTPAYSKVEVELLRAQIKSQEKLIARLEKEIERYEKNSATDKDDLIMATHNGNFKTPRMQY